MPSSGFYRGLALHLPSGEGIKTTIRSGRDIPALDTSSLGARHVGEGGHRAIVAIDVSGQEIALESADANQRDEEDGGSHAG